MLLIFLYRFSVPGRSLFGRSFLEGGTSSSSSGGLSVSSGAFGSQISLFLPPSKLLNLGSQKEALHLPLKALVFDETQLPHGKSHLY